jgi:hypothetical protein
LALRDGQLESLSWNGVSRSTETETRSMARPRIGHLAMLLALGMVTRAPARAQKPQPPAQPPPPEHPAIEPTALEMLKAMSQRLAGAKSMSFTAVTTYESPTRNGQPLYYATLPKVAVQRPNKLRVITQGDGPASELYYDGKMMMAYDPAAKLVAVADALLAIEGVMKQAFDIAAIYFPFSEAIMSDPYKNMSEGLTSAVVIVSIPVHRLEDCHRFSTLPLCHVLRHTIALRNRGMSLDSGPGYAIQ